MLKRFATTASLLTSVLLSGCADVRLNRNTEDIATTVPGLYRDQVLHNFSTLIDDEFAVPAQTDILAGTVQTTDTITPTVTIPFTPQILNSFSGASRTHSNTFSAAGGTLGASVSQQSNWNITPIVDANTLRNLRALYRHALFPTDLRKEYNPYEIEVNGSFFLDPYHLRQPRCILCYSGPLMLVGSKALTHPNERIKGAWVYWTGGARNTGRENPPPAGVPTVDLGHFGDHELFMTGADYSAGVLDNFILSIMPSGQISEAFPVVASGPEAKPPVKAGDGKGGTPAKPMPENGKGVGVPRPATGGEKGAGPAKPAAGSDRDVATPPKVGGDFRVGTPSNRVLEYVPAGKYEILPRGGVAPFSAPPVGIQNGPAQ